jgi:hypothetical protein
MKTQDQARSEFLAYFHDLQADAARDEYKVCRQAEWEFFTNHGIEEGHLPEAAREWPCPRG